MNARNTSVMSEASQFNPWVAGDADDELAVLSEATDAWAILDQQERDNAIRSYYGAMLDETQWRERFGFPSWAAPLVFTPMPAEKLCPHCDGLLHRHYLARDTDGPGPITVGAGRCEPCAHIDSAECACEACLQRRSRALNAFRQERYPGHPVNLDVHTLDAGERVMLLAYVRTVLDCPVLPAQRSIVQHTAVVYSGNPPWIRLAPIYDRFAPDLSMADYMLEHLLGSGVLGLPVIDASMNQAGRLIMEAEGEVEMLMATEKAPERPVRPTNLALTLRRPALEDLEAELTASLRDLPKSSREQLREVHKRWAASLCMRELKMLVPETWLNYDNYQPMFIKMLESRLPVEEVLTVAHNVPVWIENVVREGDGRRDNLYAQFETLLHKFADRRRKAGPDQKTVFIEDTSHLTSIMSSLFGYNLERVGAPSPADPAVAARIAKLEAELALLRSKQLA